MKTSSKLAKEIEGGGFIITAEYLPKAETNGSSVQAAASAFDGKIAAANAADNPYGVGMSSLAASVGLSKAGVEPIYQIVTRDRNRIAIQSDLLGAASLGINNMLCLSGYHQTLMGCPESANVYDIDSVQLIAAVKAMCDDGVLINGNKIDGEFSMLIGAVANPDIRPMELNMLRLGKKVEAGAAFIQTQPIFDVESFSQWMEAGCKEGLAEKTAILAGVMPLDSAAEAQELSETFTDFNIPEKVIERLKNAGDEMAQKKEGLAICTEIIGQIKGIEGIRGIHILAGGKEAMVPEVLSGAGL